MVAAAIGGGISAATGIAGAVTQGSAASASANAISAADAQAEANTQANLKTVQGLIQPYQTLGLQGATALGNQLPSLTAPFSMTQAQVSQTPGYQFNLSQGLEATQNAAAARGLGLSGAALKGASNYATGLADSTYQNQFNDYQQQQTNAYNKLYGVTGVGTNAANTYANATTGATNNTNSLLLNSAQAQAAGITGQANAISGGLNAAGSGVSNALMYNQVYGGGGAFGGGSSGGSAWDGLTEGGG